MIAIACASTVSRAVVHARGAVVTRRVQLPGELPGEPCELVIPDVTALARGASVRAVVSGARRVTALRSRVKTPAGPADLSALDERLRELERRETDLRLEVGALGQRRAALGELEFGLRVRGRAGDDPAARARDAVATAAVVSDLWADLDAALAERARAARELTRELEAVRLERQQAAGLQDGAPPRREVVVQLGAEGALEALELEYVVDAARWWPAYGARLSEGGTRAEWTLEAFVAQDTGEDWREVRLALSTADLAADARLPQLPSLRLGRAQPAPRTGFRPPPPGLDALFEGYDRATPPPPPHATTGRTPAKPPPRPAVQAAPAPPVEADLDEANFVGSPAPEPEMDLRRRSAPRADEGAGGAAPKAKKAGRGMAMSFGAPAPSSPAPGGALGGLAQEAAPPEAPREIEPAEAWLEFDALSLGDPEQRGTRGRLVRAGEPAASALADAARRRIDGLGAPRHTVDPRVARGRFDHQHEAEGLIDVPAGALAQRVVLGGAEAPCTRRLRCVAREDAAVYREVELANPFPSPLLGGPVDVFFDGALLAASEVPPVGRGGAIHLGLGVEERVRVARNARVDESTSGLLGGTALVDHHVTLELRSSLPHAASLDVVDRVPISDDEDLSVTLVSSDPPATPDEQLERGARVRGGLRWRVELPPGGTRELRFHYRLSLPAKREVEGGNRRD